MAEPSAAFAAGAGGKVARSSVRAALEGGAASAPTPADLRFSVFRPPADMWALSKTVCAQAMWALSKAVSYGDVL